jgi:hypothetical protein
LSVAYNHGSDRVQLVEKLRALCESIAERGESFIWNELLAGIKAGELGRDEGCQIVWMARSSQMTSQGRSRHSHFSVTPCSPPSRPSRCAVGAGAPSLDRGCARCLGNEWPEQENGASTEQKNQWQRKEIAESSDFFK